MTNPKQPWIERFNKLVNYDHKTDREEELCEDLMAFIRKEIDEAYTKGQVQMFNRLWDAVPLQKEDIFADTAHFALALVKELNKIRVELDKRGYKEGAKGK